MELAPQAMPDELSTRLDINSDDFVAHYDDVPLWSAPFGELLLENVPLRPGMTALDIGCGTGFPLLQLAARLGPEAQLTGIDPWEAAIKRVQSKIKYRQLTNVTAMKGDGAHTGFADETFDLVVSNLGINNFESPADVVSECRRVLKPSGVIAITTNPFGHMREFYEAYREVLHDSGRNDLVSKLDREEGHRFTIDFVTKLFAAGGFSRTRVIERTFSMRYANGTALFADSFIKLAFFPAWRSILPVQDQNSILTLLEQRLNTLASQRGALLLSIPGVYLEFLKI
jgi:arsenite methyltransferase